MKVFENQFPDLVQGFKHSGLPTLRGLTIQRVGWCVGSRFFSIMRDMLSTVNPFNVLMPWNALRTSKVLIWQTLFLIFFLIMSEHIIGCGVNCSMTSLSFNLSSHCIAELLFYIHSDWLVVLLSALVKFFMVITMLFVEAAFSYTFRNSSRFHSSVRSL